MKTHLLADPVRYLRMTTSELRESFLIDSLNQPGSIQLGYVDLDRAVVGMAVPLADPLTLESDAALRSNYFTERRELGALNIGGKGSINVGDASHPLDNLDCLYMDGSVQDGSTQEECGHKNDVSNANSLCLQTPAILSRCRRHSFEYSKFEWMSAQRYSGRDFPEINDTLFLIITASTLLR